MKSYRAVNQILDALERAKSDASSDVALPSVVDVATLQRAAAPFSGTDAAGPSGGPSGSSPTLPGVRETVTHQLLWFAGIVAGRHAARRANACCIRMATQQRPASCVRPSRTRDSRPAMQRVLRRL